uniref:N-acetylglucosaminyldiphosphodolichol N-acetylglucosaminyltransferase n=1 Tax=Rhabditophanes sp. KR3021 TaxID=114890 RepID=A0AC35TH24_9BILA
MICFVTVGSTKFDALIDQLGKEHVLEALSKMGVDKLVIQHGTSNYTCTKEDAIRHSIKLETYDYDTSLAEDMKKADFVIAHGGAGTIIDCLTLKKPFVVVENETLMDRHQNELAEKIAQLDGCYFTTPKELVNVLNKKIFDLQSKIVQVPEGSFEKRIRLMMMLD